MSLDSTAVFAKRVEELKLGPVLNDMLLKGWDTMGSFAFSCSFAPGNSDDSVFIQEVVVPLLGDADHNLKPQLRRLFFESYTQAALDVQRRAAPSDEAEKPKRLPAPERLARLRLLKTRLRGLVIEEDLEPSNALIDKFNEIKEDGTLRFVPWDELTRRDDEIKSIKKIKTWQSDSEGRLKFSEETKEDAADTNSDLKLKAALQRRGLAMEVAQLLSYETHDRYVNWLFKELTRNQPIGFHQVNIQQIHTVDQEVFTKLAELTRDGLDINNDGTFSLDVHMLNILFDPKINMLMMPRQKPVGNLQEGRQKRSFAEVSQKSNYQEKGKGQGKHQQGKNKSKKTKSGPSPSLPDALRKAKGEIVTSHNGRPICFAYNLQGCSHTPDAMGSCPKGVHVCARKGCGGNHPQSYAGCPKL
jgi:hypothetical protein